MSHEEAQAEMDRRANEAQSYKQQAQNEMKQGYNCLLYTSPSPRDRTRSRMPSSA